jgi:hypothetical protein
MRLLDAQLAAGVKVDAVQFAREHGVSVRTVYRHRARVRAEGQWSPRSRRPHSSPTATSADLQAWILKLRDDLGVDNGADFIRDALLDIHARTGPAWRVPARSTINRVLSRHDKLERNPKKRPRSSWRRFAYARPRDCYQQDATEVALAEGFGKAVIFDVLDDCTRYLVACVAHPGETAEAAVDAAQRAEQQCGAPALWLTDNSTAFTARLTRPGTGISAFTRVVTGFGTRLIHSSPYHPQTCGKVERHHQTLKQWLRGHPPAASIEQLQELLNTYREYYNNRRHSALPRRMTPTQAWAAADSLGGPTSPPRQLDATLHRCPVYSDGKICVGKTRTSVGTAHAGTTVTAIRDGTHATIYSADGQPMGRLHLDPTKRYIPLTKINHD